MIYLIQESNLQMAIKWLGKIDVKTLHMKSNVLGFDFSCFYLRPTSRADRFAKWSNIY
jgi:hypothetical protein